MAWSSGYEIVEKQIIGIYNLGKLDKEILRIIMESFSKTDIEYSGFSYNKSYDGKISEQIIIETFGLGYQELNEIATDEERDTYYEEIFAKMNTIQRYYGWYK